MVEDNLRPVPSTFKSCSPSNSTAASGYTSHIVSAVYNL